MYLAQAFNALFFDIVDLVRHGCLLSARLQINLMFIILLVAGACYTVAFIWNMKIKTLQFSATSSKICISLLLGSTHSKSSYRIIRVKLHNNRITKKSSSDAFNSFKLLTSNSCWLSGQQINLIFIIQLIIGAYPECVLCQV